LVGFAGAGKSTTAAALLGRGCSAISDDVTAFWDCRPPFLVQPSYPQLRLWPETVKHLCGSTDALPLLTPNWDKCGFDLTQQSQHFHETPLPLAKLYLLDRSATEPSPHLIAMPALESFFSLARNTYVNYLLDAPMRAAEFAALGRLRSSVPMKRAVAPNDPDRLPEFLDLLVEDFERELATDEHR
jgi:hypothetical protein